MQKRARGRRRTVRALSALAGLAVCAILPPPGRAAAAGEVVEQVAAEVNGERIMLSEVLRDARRDLAALPRGLEPAERRRRRETLIRSHLLDLVRRKLVLQEARRELTAPQKAAVENRVDERIEAMARDAGSREALEERLRREGTSLEELTSEVRRQVMISTFLALKIRTGVHVTQREALDYYRRHRSDFQKPERRVWRMMVIRPDRFSDPSGARRRAEQVRRRLLAGEDFAALVREFSHGVRAAEGGLWGPMGPDEFAVSEVAEAVFSLPPGKVSPVIATPSAFYLVKVERVEPAVRKTFAEVQDKIVERLRREELARRREEFVRRLEERSFIRIHYK